MVSDKIILGIDPGTIIMGYGLVHIRNKNIELINFGIIKLAQYQSHQDKLKKIFERITELITEYKPDEIRLRLLFWKECSINVKTRKGSRGCNGCGT